MREEPPPQTQDQGSTGPAATPALDVDFIRRRIAALTTLLQYDTTNTDHINQRIKALTNLIDYANAA